MEGNTLEALPVELKFNILRFLPNFLDHYNLAQACRDFKEFIHSKLCSIDLSHDCRMDDVILPEVINLIPHPECITRLNLNGLYWMDAEIIKMAVMKFPNLEILFLVDTKVTLTQAIVDELSVLNKLHALAISRVNTADYTRTFAVVNNDEGCCIRCLNGKHELYGNAMLILVAPNQVLEFKSSCVLSGREWINQICNCRSFDEFQSEQIQYYNEFRLVILYDTLLEIENIPESRAEILQITELFVKNPQYRGLWVPNDMSFLPISYFANLRKLSIEISTGTTCDFLKNVFEECGDLRSLKIYTQDPDFTLNYLKHAGALEELSFSTKGDVNFGETLGELPNVAKLRRVYIRCKRFLEFRTGFLLENPQLAFFHVDVPGGFWTLREALRGLERHPSRHFEISESRFHPCVRSIPISHLDMVQIDECFGHNPANISRFYQ